MPNFPSLFNLPDYRGTLVVPPNPQPATTPQTKPPSLAIPPAVSCPEAKNTIGVVVMPSEIIANILGALNDPKEWAIILTGTRSHNGACINVTNYFIPEQKRSGGAVDDIKFTASPDIVGVIHSHHSLGAFFSKDDIERLNTLFGLSIVVARSKSRSIDHPDYANDCTRLGFYYYALGKHTPHSKFCSRRIESEFRIVDSTWAGSAKLPYFKEGSLLADLDSDEGRSLTGCPNVQLATHETQQFEVTDCGIIGEDVIKREYEPQFMLFQQLPTPVEDFKPSYTAASKYLQQNLLTSNGSAATIQPVPKKALELSSENFLDRLLEVLLDGKHHKWEELQVQGQLDTLTVVWERLVHPHTSIMHTAACLYALSLMCDLLMHPEDVCHGLPELKNDFLQYAHPELIIDLPPDEGGLK